MVNQDYKLYGLLIAIVIAITLPAATAAEEQTWWDVATPSPLHAHAIGGPSRGCLAGAKALPLSGPGYEVMRPSRQRFYGHPRTIALIRDFAALMQKQGWPGLLIGDISQARGGPMKTGHRSHQSGLDVDIWFRSPPATLSLEDRETLPATSLVAANGRDINTQAWTDDYVLLLKTAAGFSNVQRIFVHPAIKATVCSRATGDRSWLRKIRPWWGHNYHFHVRLRCSKEDQDCVDQDTPAPGDGCGQELAWWFSQEAALNRSKKSKRAPARTLSLDELPSACRTVLFAPSQAR